MEQGLERETESACNVNAKAGAGAKSPLWTHRCLAPSRLNSQGAESSPSYAGALSTLPATCTPLRAPLRSDLHKARAAKCSDLFLGQS